MYISMQESYDAIVVLGHGSADAAGQHDIETFQRVSKGVELFNKGYAHHIVMSGCKTFLNRGSPRPVAFAMQDTAIEQGIAEEYIAADPVALCTISNGYFTKKDILEPNAWKRIVVVTSPSHLERTTSIFKQVLGDTYDIKPMAAPESPRRAQKMYEVLGKCLEQMVLGGIPPGDDEAILTRLQSLIPGYVEMSKAQMVKNYIQGIGRIGGTIQ